ncbi:hypothetical protein SERLA73DRAFT_77016 [Serpula lacrymans var. lacrymans S7.3]|uniref:Uncharacterized protein n=1 Tax=Serpula lacrymans var. lacrymans (strain S7.3) TaxID=936435 RepID=F8Q8U4_SERL3|nr:hypothetical protein SERLA73DRAFT_77016 [Serpula lacrymans var. lacrymans S7.3]
MDGVHVLSPPSPTLYFSTTPASSHTDISLSPFYWSYRFTAEEHRASAVPLTVESSADSTSARANTTLDTRLCASHRPLIFYKNWALNPLADSSIDGMAYLSTPRTSAASPSQQIQAKRRIKGVCYVSSGHLAVPTSTGSLFESATTTSSYSPTSPHSMRPSLFPPHQSTFSIYIHYHPSLRLCTPTDMRSFSSNAMSSAD